MRLDVLSGSVQDYWFSMPNKGKCHYKHYITVKLIQYTIQICIMTLIDPFGGNFCIGTYGLTRKTFRKYFYQLFECF